MLWIASRIILYNKKVHLLRIQIKKAYFTMLHLAFMILNEWTLRTDLVSLVWQFSKRYLCNICNFLPKKWHTRYNISKFLMHFSFSLYINLEMLKRTLSNINAPAAKRVTANSMKNKERYAHYKHLCAFWILFSKLTLFRMASAS